MVSNSSQESKFRIRLHSSSELVVFSVPSLYLFLVTGTAYLSEMVIFVTVLT